MDFQAILIDIIVYVLSGLIIFFAGWYVVRAWLDIRFKVEMLELKRENTKHTLPLRLQAYERMAIFIDRINPAQLLIRLHVKGISAREMQQLILSEINSEYQHNISQQLYIGEPSWLMIRKLKDETISLINNVVEGLSAEASSTDLSRAVLQHLANLEDENPYDLASGVIRQEMQSLF